MRKKMEVKEEKKVDMEEPKSEGYIPEEMGDFDPRVVHLRDPKTGQMTKANPFKVIVDSNIKYYEHPRGSGNLWWENRLFAGRLDEKGRPVRGAKHMPYTPPMTIDEEVARKNVVLEQENKKLAAELSEIQKEKELNVTHPKADVKSDKDSKSNDNKDMDKADKKPAKS